MDSNLISEQLLSTTSVVWGVIFYIVYAVTMWRVFSKAGYPGILALIPIVNWIFLVKIAGMTGWAALLYLIPIVNVIFAIVVAIKEGRNFGKGGVFSFFLLFLFPYIGHLIIGFGSAEYRKV
ncbi:hypothetical protein JOD62_000811 [Microbacterium keratanolyticum]|uniref:Signal peptidase I n=1 Tax=Microbacterium keratanolyticum TaxID=67574 RepID=A0A9W6M7E3_9MICO|nr:DUF5684 domain-containing protein [Microbacterium keratanolyticum]MBM7468263.1 hypothetical protein [Microbacterium keratanolyticum]GLK00338.1 hypothetical protein GCM10017596_00530 [Microbacterium keratanolyticum]